MVQGRAVIGGGIAAKHLPHDERFGGRLTPWPKAPGEFRYEDLGQSAAPPPAPGERGRFGYGCPLGTGNCGSVVIINGAKQGPKTWGWNGNVERPTLTPSINCLSHNPKTGEKYAGCGWHGWLKDGIFTDA